MDQTHSCPIAQPDGDRWNLLCGAAGGATAGHLMPDQAATGADATAVAHAGDAPIRPKVAVWRTTSNRRHGRGRCRTPVRPGSALAAAGGPIPYASSLTLGLVLVAPPGVKADVAEMLSRPGVTGLLAHNFGLTWPDHSGRAVASADRTAGHPICPSSTHWLTR